MQWCRNASEKSLKDLGIETIDLYYQHRVDPKTPIEETVKAMAVGAACHMRISASYGSACQPHASDCAMCLFNAFHLTRGQGGRILPARGPSLFQARAGCQW